jgi:hypothetical protein
VAEEAYSVAMKLIVQSVAGGAHSTHESPGVVQCKKSHVSVGEEWILAAIDLPLFGQGYGRHEQWVGSVELALEVKERTGAAHLSKLEAVSAV